MKTQDRTEPIEVEITIAKDGEWKITKASGRPQDIAWMHHHCDGGVEDVSEAIREQCVRSAGKYKAVVVMEGGCYGPPYDPPEWDEYFYIEAWERISD